MSKVPKSESPCQTSLPPLKVGPVEAEARWPAATATRGEHHVAEHSGLCLRYTLANFASSRVTYSYAHAKPNHAD